MSFSSLVQSREQAWEQTSGPAGRGDVPAGAGHNPALAELTTDAEARDALTALTHVRSMPAQHRRPVMTAAHRALWQPELL